MAELIVSEAALRAYVGTVIEFLTALNEYDIVDEELSELGSRIDLAFEPLRQSMRPVVDTEAS